MYESEVLIVMSGLVIITAIWAKARMTMRTRDVTELKELLRKVLKEVS